MALRSKEGKKNTVKKNTIVATLKKVHITVLESPVSASYLKVFSSHTTVTAGGDELHIQFL